MFRVLFAAMLILHQAWAHHWDSEPYCAPGEADHQHQEHAQRLNSYSTKLMLELYNILNKNDNEVDQPGVRIKRHNWYDLKEQARYLSADEIAKGEISDMVYSMRPMDGGFDGNTTMMKMEFSMPKIEPDAKVLTAELKLFQIQQDDDFDDDVYMITVCRRTIVHGVEFMYKAGKVITSVNFSGWLTIDISPVFKNWVKNRTQNYELHVSAAPYNTRTFEVDPRSLGLVFQHGHPENEPFILAFLKSDSVEHMRYPRQVNPQPSFNEVNLEERKCSLHPFTVDFKELNMDKIVLAPEQYVTGVCRGDCSFPIKFPMEVSQHAIVQSLMHIKKPHRYPGPMCAPTDYFSMSALVQQGTNTVFIVYPNMLVKSCACF